MNPVDVHPEDLLDKALKGALSYDEQRRLEMHVVHCHACRLEWRATHDFAAERQLSAADDQAILRVLARTSTQLAGEATGEFPRSASLPARRRPRWIGYGLAAAILFVAAGAAAVFRAYRSDIPAEPALTIAQPAPARTATAQKPVREAIAEVAKPEPAPAPEPTPEPRRAAVRSSGTAKAVTHSAGELFTSANEARRRGDYQAALKRYAELQQRYPGSSEALTSRALAGRLLLDRMRDPAGALSSFDHYLARQRAGALAEEARVGRALALTALGRRGEARNAWQTLLQKHPKSVHAERAKRRIEELK